MVMAPRVVESIMEMSVLSCVPRTSFWYLWQSGDPMEAINPEILENQAKLRQKYGDSGRLAGKNGARYRRKVVGTGKPAGDTRKLQAAIKRMGLSQLPGVEEVAMVKEDGKAIVFSTSQLKVQAAINANTFIVSGPSEEKRVDQVFQLPPDIDPEMLRKFAAEFQKIQDSNIPELVVDDFEAVANDGRPYSSGGGGSTRLETFSKAHREQLALGGGASLGPTTRHRNKARITVVVRKRPLSSLEHTRNETDILKVESKTLLRVDEPRKNVCGFPYIETHNFEFDRSYSEFNTNLEVYNSCVKHMVEAVFRKGARCSCFAYGQTGSGKTYTMIGPSKLGCGTVEPCDRGLLELAAEDCFERLGHPELAYHMGLYVSFYEVYCNKVYDLLNQRRLVRALETKTSGGGVIVKDLTNLRVEDLSSILKAISSGLDQRVVASNSKNADSSRGHAILNLEIKNENTSEIFGKMVFADLAGSERGQDAMGSGKSTQVDGAGINRSLLALKECIRALDLQSSHVPFRDSELTKVLRDMFVGSNANTIMISCVSPSSGCCEQTLNTLRYADRVKAIRRNCKPSVDVEVPPPNKKIVSEGEESSTPSLGTSHDSSHVPPDPTSSITAIIQEEEIEPFNRNVQKKKQTKRPTTEASCRVHRVSDGPAPPSTATLMLSTFPSSCITEVNKADLSKVFPKPSSNEFELAANVIRKKHREISFPLQPAEITASSSSSSSLEIETARQMLRGLRCMPSVEVKDFHSKFNAQLNGSFRDMVKFHTDVLKAQTCLQLCQNRMLKDLKGRSGEFTLSTQYISELRIGLESQLAILIRLGKRVAELEKMSALESYVRDTYEGSRLEEHEEEEDDEDEAGDEYSTPLGGPEASPSVESTLLLEEGHQPEDEDNDEEENFLRKANKLPGLLESIEETKDITRSMDHEPIKVPPTPQTLGIFSNNSTTSSSSMRKPRRNLGDEQNLVGAVRAALTSSSRNKKSTK